MHNNHLLVFGVIGMCGLLAGCDGSDPDGMSSSGDSTSSSSSSGGGTTQCNAGQSALRLSFVLGTTLMGTGPSDTLTPLIGRRMQLTVCIMPQADADPEPDGARFPFDGAVGTLEGADAKVWPQELVDQLSKLTGFVWFRNNANATGISIEFHGATYPQWKFTADSGVTPKVGVDGAGNQTLAPFSGYAMGPSDLRIFRLDVGGYTDGAGGPGSFSLE